MSGLGLQSRIRRVVEQPRTLDAEIARLGSADFYLFSSYYFRHLNPRPMPL